MNDTTHEEYESLDFYTVVLLPPAKTHNKNLTFLPRDNKRPIESPSKIESD